MPNVTLQAPTPFRDSILWRLHNAYFAQRGAAAWKKGEVPHYSTSNYATASDRVAVLAAMVADRGADERPIWVMEVGSGLGLFAANFLTVIADDPRFEALRGRVHYVLSDYSRANVEQALAQPRLKPFVEQGRVVGALFDLYNPQRISLLDGGTLTHAPLLVITNYVCCVLPQVHLQKMADGSWRDLHVEVRVEQEPGAEVKDMEAWASAVAEDATRFNELKNMQLHYSWVPVELDTLFAGDDGETHQTTVLSALSKHPTATVGYPATYLSAMDAMGPLLADDGAILTVDYGSGNNDRLRGHVERRPQMYGNSLAQDVNMTLFEHWATVSGWHCTRSTNDLWSLQMAMLSRRPLGEATQAELDAQLTDQKSHADDVLDMAAAAKAFAKRKESKRALRYYLRAIALDPWHMEYRYAAGELAIEVGDLALAIKHLERGHAMDVAGERDFDFHLGRAHSLLENIPEAVRWYEHSLLREKHPVTMTNLGVLHIHAGRHAQAYGCFRDALALDPSYHRAQERLDKLKDIEWKRTVADYETLLADEPDTDTDTDTAAITENA